MVMIKPTNTKLTEQDICRHEPKCEWNEWFYVTVPNHKTFSKAAKWLRDERNYKLVSAYSVRDGDKHTGAFRFKFLCEQEAMWFALRWSCGSH